MNRIISLVSPVLLAAGAASAQTPYGLAHNPVGGANLAIVGNALQVSNLPGPGNPGVGVEITTGRTEGIGVKLGALNPAALPNGSTFGLSPFLQGLGVLAQIGLRDNGGRFDVVADFTGHIVANIRVDVVNNGVTVHSAIVPAAALAGRYQIAFPVPIGPILLYEPRWIEPPPGSIAPPCAYWGHDDSWDHFDVFINAPAGPIGPITADWIVMMPVAANQPVPEDSVVNAQVTANGTPAITITQETVREFAFWHSVPPPPNGTCDYDTNALGGVAMDLISNAAAGDIVTIRPPGPYTCAESGPAPLGAFAVQFETPAPAAISNGFIHAATTGFVGGTLQPTGELDLTQSAVAITAAADFASIGAGSCIVELYAAGLRKYSFTFAGPAASVVTGLNSWPNMLGRVKDNATGFVISWDQIVSIAVPGSGLGGPVGADEARILAAALPVPVDCLETFSLGSDTDVGTLRVTAEGFKNLCRSDFNDSGVSDVGDIFLFLAAYFGGDPIADVDESGGLSVGDIFHFLAIYFTGC